MQPEPSSFVPPRITLCVGAVVRHADQILFVRQTYGYLTGKWSLPWGFVAERGEDGQPEPPHVAAVRETLEEAGITAEVEGLLGIQNHISEEGDTRLYLVYLCRHLSGEPTPDGAETDQTAYFSQAELEQCADQVDEFCLWLAQRVLAGDYHMLPPMIDNPYSPHLAFF